jgi:putative redox protein
MDDNWRAIQVEWKSELSFIGSNPAGGTVQIGSLDHQPGFSPMELLLVGLAGCTGMDVVSILQKKRKNISACKIEVRGRRADTDPKVYQVILIDYHLWGSDLDDDSVAHAIQLSKEKYCSASAMLGAVAQIQTDFHIYQPE